MTVLERKNLHGGFISFKEKASGNLRLNTGERAEKRCSLGNYIQKEEHYRGGFSPESGKGVGLERGASA